MKEFDKLEKCAVLKKKTNYALFTIPWRISPSLFYPVSEYHEIVHKEVTSFVLPFNLKCIKKG